MAGGPAAYVALLVYLVMVVGSVAGMRFFCNIFLAEAFAIDISWKLVAAVCLLITAFVGYREISLGARLLAVLLLLEVLVLVVLAFGVLMPGSGAPVSAVLFIAEALMVASALAATIALHNAAARYIFALPREGMLPPAFGLASLGIASLQAVTSAAVIAFFLRHPAGEAGRAVNILIGVIATLCLAGIALLIVLNYSVLAGDLGGA